MARTTKNSKKNTANDSRELLEALTILEKEKNISKEVLLEAIENSLLTACKNHFGKADNIKVDINPVTCEYHVFAEKLVVEEVADPVMEISVEEAKKRDPGLEAGDIIQEEIQSKSFGRIATQNAKNVILQKIREEERKVIYDQYYEKSRDIVTGIVQRYIGKNMSINLGKADAILNENEMIRGEHYEPTDRIKVFILEVKNTSKGPKILVSRTHPDLVKRLFEQEVSEVRDGIVEIKCIAREAGSRTKIAVSSNDPDVDPVGACVGMNGSRVNAIVDELNGEKIDIINWNENPAMLIENALSPAKVISVIADGDEKTAKVVVPDYQLSLAIGKEGQNARLAARLTGFKIDIKSETQAREAGDFMDYENEYEDEDEYLDYEEDYEGDYADDGYGDDSYGDGYGDSYEEEPGGGPYRDGSYEGQYDEPYDDGPDGERHEDDSYEDGYGDSYQGEYDEPYDGGPEGERYEDDSNEDGYGDSYEDGYGDSYEEESDESYEDESDGERYEDDSYEDGYSEHYEDRSGGDEDYEEPLPDTDDAADGGPDGEEPPDDSGEGGRYE